MNARKLLTLAGSIGVTVATWGALSPSADAAQPYEPLVDKHGRPAPGNVVGKGEPPKDAGTDGSK